MNRDEFLAAFKRKPVPVGVNGTTYHLVPLSRFDLRDIVARADNAEQIALALARSITDGSGSRLFADEQIDQLGGMLSVDQQDVIYEEIHKLNKFQGDSGKAHSPANPS